MCFLLLDDSVKVAQLDLGIALANFLDRLPAVEPLAISGHLVDDFRVASVVDIDEHLLLEFHVLFSLVMPKSRR